jgi:outer membrane protein assembly factor BamB
MLRGHLALSAEALREVILDEQRIAPPRVAAKQEIGKATDLTLPVSSEWSIQINNGALETAPVELPNKNRLVAVTHEHRLECRDAGGTVVWAFRAGGRISSPPVVHEDLVLFGAHDGYAYALRAADGALVWKFLAAPFERFFVSHGQIESAYPVYNVVIFEGKACFTAGLHPEVGGGIRAWGVDPRTGLIAWRKHFKRSDVIAKPGTKIAPNRVLNSPITIDAQTLAITGLNFIPDEPDADIQKRIDTASVGDKLRNLGWTIRGTKPEKR